MHAFENAEIIGSKKALSTDAESAAKVPALAITRRYHWKSEWQLNQIAAKF